MIFNSEIKIFFPIFKTLRQQIVACPNSLSFEARAMSESEMGGFLCLLLQRVKVDTSSLKEDFEEQQGSHPGISSAQFRVFILHLSSGVYISLSFPFYLFHFTLVVFLSEIISCF